MITFAISINVNNATLRTFHRYVTVVKFWNQRDNDLYSTLTSKFTPIWCLPLITRSLFYVSTQPVPSPYYRNWPQGIALNSFRANLVAWIDSCSNDQRFASYFFWHDMWPCSSWLSLLQFASFLLTSRHEYKGNNSICRRLEVNLHSSHLEQVCPLCGYRQRDI